MEILKTVGLKKYYGKDASLVKALDGVDLSVEEGEFVAWQGPVVRENPLCSICWEGWIILQKAKFL